MKKMRLPTSVPGTGTNKAGSVHIFLLLMLFALSTAVHGDEEESALTRYWQTPISLQSPAPPTPQSCGTCHPQQFSDWSGSRHAHAFSPGLLGQIVDYDDTDITACLACHAPLADQQGPLFQAGVEQLAANPDTHEPELAARHGVYCPVCHLRRGKLHAPSPGPPETGPRYHDSVQTTPMMRDSRFCAPCHQFDTAEQETDKPLQNTYREWLDSPFAKQGKSCQSCHMPDRAHRFRGIHDPDMVRRGVTITTRTNSETALLVVRSTGVGHHFPSYIVPRIRLTGTLLDSNGRPLPGGYKEQVLQRRMSIYNGNWVEHSDTRLAPGEAGILSLPWGSGRQCGKTIEFRVIVEPEWFYQEEVYPVVLDELEEGPARDLIKQAKATAESHNFVLYQASQAGKCSE